MKKLIILRGLPGSGKSTLAAMFPLLMNQPYQRAIACSADDYFTIDGEYKFDHRNLHAAHLYCRLLVQSAMFDEMEVIVVHNTTTTEKELQVYLDLADAYGYEATSLIVENRHGGKNVHGVPEEALERMENRFSVKLR